MGTTCSCTCENSEEKAPNSVELDAGPIVWRQRKDASYDEPAPSPLPLIPLQAAFRAYLSRRVLPASLNLTADDSLPPQGVGPAATDPQSFLTLQVKETCAKLPTLSLNRSVKGAISQGPQLLQNGDIYLGEWSPGLRVPMGRGCLYATDGSFYEGYWKNGEFHHFGRSVYPNGDHYEGSFASGQRAGFGKFETSGGKCKYEGAWREDMRWGRGKEVYADGSRYEGDYSCDIKSGRGHMWWTDGSSYAGNFLEEKITGQGEYRWVDGRHYVGQWLNGQMHGHGSFSYSDGSRYSGAYCFDQKHGHGIYCWAGNEYDGEWQDGKMHGLGWVTKSSGERKRFEYVRGERLRELPT